MVPRFELADLQAGYGRLQVLRGVSLAVQPGECVALLGPNGAGKTTLVYTAMGLLESEGDIRLDGQSIARLPVEARVERGMALVPERRQLFPDLSVQDNLVLGAYHRRRQDGAEIRRDIESVYHLFPVLRDRAREPVRRLSGGMQQMVAIGRALMARPRMLLLDEPLLGLAPLIVREILRVLGELKGGGLALLVVEQNAAPVLRMADRAYVLQGGRVVLEGPARVVMEHPQLAAAYLGAAG